MKDYIARARNVLVLTAYVTLVPFALVIDIFASAGKTATAGAKLIKSDFIEIYQDVKRTW